MELIFLGMIALKLALKSLKFNNWLNRENNAFVRIYGKIGFWSYSRLIALPN